MHKYIPVFALVMFVTSLVLGHAAGKRRTRDGWRNRWHRSSYVRNGWGLWVGTEVSATIFMVLGLIWWLPGILGR